MITRQIVFNVTVKCSFTGTPLISAQIFAINLLRKDKMCLELLVCYFLD